MALDLISDLYNIQFQSHHRYEGAVCPNVSQNDILPIERTEDIPVAAESRKTV